MTTIISFRRVMGIAALAFAGARTAIAQSTPRSPASASTSATSTRTPQTAAQRRAVLLDPKRPFWSAHAPDTVTADIETSRGTIQIELIRAWAPAGVDRFYNLARAGFFDDSRFFRVIYGFIAQFGVAGDPAIANLWGSRKLPADSARERNVRGTLSYAQFTPTDRTTNVFINMRDSPSLDALGFAPIGRVVQGMDVVDSLYAGYGEVPVTDIPPGNAERLYAESNKYLDANYPKLDRIVKITFRADSSRAP
jgi:peptidyl-prolyl cis-trans isomerase A (cyclophilin A)